MDAVDHVLNGGGEDLLEGGWTHHDELEVN